MRNFENQLYYGNLFFGSDMQQMELIFDSGSDWLMVEGKDCSTCDGTTYDTDASIYFNERSSTEENRTFGTIIHLKGRTVSDWVCLQLYEMCVQPFQWFIITEQYGLPTG